MNFHEKNDFYSAEYENKFHAQFNFQENLFQDIPMT